MKYLFAAAALLAVVAAVDPLNSEDYTNKIKDCPGYAINDSQTEQTANGIKTYLQLAGDTCNAFGDDVQNLVLEATYETRERLHVKIYDEVGVSKM